MTGGEKVACATTFPIPPLGNVTAAQISVCLSVLYRAKASPVQGEVSKIYLIFDGGVDNPPVKIGSEEPILPIACGQSGRGSGCPPDSHSLPRLRFAYPLHKGAFGCGAYRNDKHQFEAIWA